MEDLQTKLSQRQIKLKGQYRDHAMVIRQLRTSLALTIPGLTLASLKNWHWEKNGVLTLTADGKTLANELFLHRPALLAQLRKQLPVRRLIIR